MLVIGGSPVNFNYVAFDGQTGLFMAGVLVDITTGSPVIVGSPIPMTDEGNGVYMGIFTPVQGKNYLVITASYTDGTYATASTNRPPGALNYDTFSSNNALLTFNYATYDFNSGLTIEATVMNLTNNSQVSFNMVYATLGTYFGIYQGAVGKDYLVLKIPNDSDYSSGSDSFQTFNLGTVTIVSKVKLHGALTSATLKTKTFKASLIGGL